MWPFRSATPPQADYQSADIADLVVAKTRRFLTARASDIVAGETLLPTLLAAACARGDRVLDFGGAAGAHYFAAREAFPERRFMWAVVEHPLVTARANALASDRLRFFTSIADAHHWLGHIDLLHSNGTLQYLDKPEAALAELLALRPDCILWARLLLGSTRTVGTEKAPLSWHGPGALPRPAKDRKVLHRFVRMQREQFFAVHVGYRTVWRAADGVLLQAL